MRIESLGILTSGTTWRNLIIVKLTTDDGRVGLGEATIEYGDRALIAYLPEIFGRAVKGRDPGDIDGVMAAMVHADYWRSGFIARTAFSGIELACWDLRGHAEGRPVWQLIGGRRPDPLPAYANGWYRTDRDPVRVAAAARDVVERGYRAMKIDPFGAGIGNLALAQVDLSMAIIREVRAAVGDDVALFVEGHGRFDLDCATTLARRMEPYHPDFFEEPLIPELNHQLPQLIRRTDVTIALGERLSTPAAFEPLCGNCAKLVLQPDICHIGGISGLRAVAAMARERGWRLAPHNAGGPLATTHAVHLGLATPTVAVQEVFDDFEEPWVGQAFAGRARVRDGRFGLPEQPGFGVQADEAILAEHPMTDQHLDLFAEGWEQRRTEAMT